MIIIYRWFCKSSFGKGCEDELRQNLTHLLVKSTPLDDPDFFTAVDEYWNSDNSKMLQAVLKPTSRDDATLASNRDDITTKEKMAGAYAFPHSVPDGHSELLNLFGADGNRVNREAITEIVSSLRPIHLFFLLYYLTVVHGLRACFVKQQRGYLHPETLRQAVKFVAGDASEFAKGEAEEEEGSSRF